MRWSAPAIDQQQLEGDRRPARVARHQRDQRWRDCRPALSPPYGDCGGFYSQIFPVLNNESEERKKAIVDGSRNGASGRLAVFHREHRAARAVGERAADDVMRVQVADHPAAAVKIDERRQHLVLAGAASRAVGGAPAPVRRVRARAAARPIRPPADRASARRACRGTAASQTAAGTS